MLKVGDMVYVKHYPKLYKIPNTVIRITTEKSEKIVDVRINTGPTVWTIWGKEDGFSRLLFYVHKLLR